MTEVVSLPVKKDYIHQRHTLCDSRMKESQSSKGKVLNYLTCKNKHPPAFFLDHPLYPSTEGLDANFCQPW